MDFTMFLNGHIMGIVIDGILMGQQQLVGGLKVDGFKYVLFSILSGMIVPSDLFTYITDIIYYTSSTAQGGGGSFKNRKPIGEIGCCESGMAERSH